MSDDEKNLPQTEIAASHQRIAIQPFWPQRANTWFQLAEIQFGLQGITADKTKYMQILSALQPETCDVISDFLLNPPTTNQYNKLKETLLERLAPSSERQLEQLLSGQQLGDRTPSDALRHIQTLANNNFTENIIRSLWIRKMPELIRIALVAQPESSTTQMLARIADKMYDVININNQSISQVNSPYRQSRERSGDRTPRSTVPNSLEARMSRIESRLDGLLRGRSRSRGRRAPSPKRTRSPSNNRYRQGKCWFHEKFGKAARKCTPPCNFNTSQPSTSAAAVKMDIDNQKNY